MRIAVASDHAGFALKAQLMELLSGQGHDLTDFGAFDETACDLPDTVYPAALAVGRGDADRGVFVDGVGYGSAMIANKVLGVDAAVCQDPVCAELARAHSNTNVLCLGAKIIGSVLAVATVETWMSTEFLGDTGGDPKYARRVGKVREISERHLRPLDDV